MSDDDTMLPPTADALSLFQHIGDALQQLNERIERFSIEDANRHAGVADLHAGLIQRLNDLGNLQLQASQTQLQAAQHRASKARYGTPGKFNGKADGIEPFFSQLHILFSSEPRAYDTPRSKVFAALSYMTEGPAVVKWASTQTSLYEQGETPFATYADFKGALKSAFGGSNSKTIAQEEIKKLKQKKGQDAQAFFIDFEEYKSDTGFNDDALISLLRHQLDPALVERITEMENIPSTYDDYKKFATRFDANRGTAPAQGFRSNNPFAPKNLPRPNTTATISHPSTSGVTYGGKGEPMSIDRTRGAASVKCFNCGKPGHYARECRDRRNDSVRGLMESLSNEEREGLAQTLHEQGFGAGLE